MADQFPPTSYVMVESKIDGIQIYKPALPELGPHQEIVDFKCPQCGGTTGFSSTQGSLVCPYCGYSESPVQAKVGKKAAQYEFTVATVEQAAQGWGEERKELVCQNCGAVTSLPKETLSHCCPFCASNKVIQRSSPQDILRPRFLVPFKLKDIECAKITREWLGSSWMTPASLKSAATLGNLTAIYLPFWTFHSMTSADWKAQVGHPKKERYFSNGEWKERTVIEWRWESGQAELNINDLIISGTGRVSQKLLNDIQDYNLADLVAYEPKYLAGFQAHGFDVNLEKAWEAGRQVMREKTRQACIEQASTSQIRNFSMSLDFADESWRYILLPAYLSVYKYADQNYVLGINGQSGRISGQRPVDWNKVWLVIGLLVAPGLLLGLLGLITIPFGGLGFGIGLVGFILLVIGVILSLIIYSKASSLDKL